MTNQYLQSQNRRRLSCAREGKFCVVIYVEAKNYFNNCPLLPRGFFIYS